jgi:hypothetical protein
MVQKSGSNDFQGLVDGFDNVVRGAPPLIPKLCFAWGQLSLAGRLGGVFYLYQVRAPSVAHEQVTAVF